MKKLSLLVLTMLFAGTSSCRDTKKEQVELDKTLDKIEAVELEVEETVEEVEQKAAEVEAAIKELDSL